MDLKLAGFVFLLIAGVSAQDTTTPGQVVCTVAGELFPVQDNCQEFWFCNSELVPYLYTCAAGQYFDSDLLSCNPEETVNCGSRATPTTETTTTPVTTTTTAPATTSPGQIVCTVAGELFPNQANCQEFWFCNTDLVPYVYTCAAGEYFDEDQLSCNPEETVNCGSRATPSTTTTTPAPTSPTTSPGQIVCTVAGELFPDQANCQDFWFCNTDLVPYVYTCANGEYFDEDTLSCNPEATVDCGSRPTPSTTSTSTAVPTPSAGQNCDYVSELLPDCSDCNAFFECDALLNPVYMQCPEGEYFSLTDNDCQDSGNVNCVDGVRPGNSCP